jgi:hypothetical protein
MLLPSASIALMEASHDDGRASGVARGAGGGARPAQAVASVASSYCLELHMLGVQRVKDTAFMHGAWLPDNPLRNTPHAAAPPGGGAKVSGRADTPWWVCRGTVGLRLGRATSCRKFYLHSL